MNRQLLRQSRFLINYYPKRSNAQFEPPYLDETKDEIPSYPLLNVQVKGYDFSVLERYAKWVHNTAVHMNIEVEDSWAAPCEKSEIVTYKRKTEIVENKYNLQIFERNVQIELPTTVAPIFVQVIRAALPEGVSLSVHEHMQEHYDFRKIPDLELRKLRKELDELGGPTPTKK